MSMDPVAFVDIETTGLDPELHEVWQVGLITPGDEEFLWYLPVSLVGADPESLRINRYHERSVGVPLTPRPWFADQFANLTYGLHLAGNVVSFDEERLRKILRRAGVTPGWHYHLVDTESLVAGKLGLKPPWKSRDLSLAIGIEPPSNNEAHDALHDARWAKRMYEAVYADTDPVHTEDHYNGDSRPCRPYTHPTNPLLDGWDC